MLANLFYFFIVIVDVIDDLFNEHWSVGESHEDVSP